MEAPNTREVLTDFFRRPSMYIISESYKEAVAFVQGVNFALEEPILNGFSGFLSNRLNFGENLSWQALVLPLAFPDAEEPRSMLNGNRPGNERLAIKKLGELLDEHLLNKNKKETK